MENENHWERIVASIGVVGSNSFTWAVKRRDFEFQPLAGWDKEVNVKVTLRKPDHQQVMLNKNFKVDPDAWPVTIDTVAMRKQPVTPTK